MIETIDLTPIFNLIIAVAAAFVAAYAIPWIKARTQHEDRTELLAWVSIAVAAAEQLFAGKGRGAEKLEYALNFLRSRGFDVDLHSLTALVEATVLDLNQRLFVEDKTPIETDGAKLGMAILPLLKGGVLRTGVDE